MYWYGWISLAIPSALLVALIATTIPDRVLRLGTVFCCTLAALWPTFNSLGIAIDRWGDRADRRPRRPGLVAQHMVLAVARDEVTALAERR
jgi:hypothetical protein